MKTLAQITTTAFALTAISLPVMAGGDSPIVAWAHDAGAHISGEMKYPRIAVRYGETGSPQFKVTVDRDGHVIALDTIDRSWSSTINRAAKKLVKNAEFPDLPKAYGKETLTFSVTLNYMLADSAMEARRLRKAAATVSTQKLAKSQGPLSASIRVFEPAG